MGHISKFLQCKPNLFFYSIIGWNLSRSMVFLLGKLHFLINYRDRRRITRAVRQAVGSGMSRRKFSKLLSRVLDGILSHYYEKLYIAFEEAAKATHFIKKTIAPDGLQVLQDKICKGKGVLMVTGHYGAIEYIPVFLAVNGFPVTIIARFKTEQLKKKVFKQAETYGVRLIDADCEDNVMKTAARELKENRILVTECDEMEEWRPSPRRFISFLGRVTGLDRTINVLHKRTGAEVVFSVIHRHSLDRYSFIVHPLEDGPGEGAGSRLGCVGSEVLKTLEGYILRYPEQWYQWKNYFSIGASVREDAGLLGEMKLTFQSPAGNYFPERLFGRLSRQLEI